MCHKQSVKKLILKQTNVFYKPILSIYCDKVVSLNKQMEAAEDQCYQVLQMQQGAKSGWLL